MTRLIFDGHQDIVWYQNKNTDWQQTSFEKIIQNSIKLVNGSVFLDFKEYGDISYRDRARMIENQIEEYLYYIKKYDELMLVCSLQDLELLMNSQKTGILLHIEGLDFLAEETVGLLDRFYELGVRSLGLTWIHNNKVAHAAGSHRGLTLFGETIIEKLIDKAFLIDLAHASEQTFFDVIQRTKMGVYVSHANTQFICNHKRNLSDKQIRILQNLNSVMGVFFSAKYVADIDNVLIDTLVEHIEHIYNISPETVMLGTDFGGITSGFIQGLESVEQLNELEKVLIQRLGAEAVDKIYYQNYLRFLTENI